MKKILLILILLISLCACGDKNDVVVIEPVKPNTPYNQQAFPTIPDIEDNYNAPLNTMVSVKSTRADIDALMINLEPILTKGHKLFDGYHYYRDNDDNLVMNIKMINDHYNSGETLTIDQELADFLNKVIRLAELTEGYFNPFMGKLINLYDGKFSPFPVTNTDPDAELIKEALNSVVPYDKMREVLVIEGNTLKFNAYNDQESVILNVGAASKGQVANDLHEYLVNESEEYLLDIGSSNILTNSTKGAMVGIRSPYNKVASIYTINLTDKYALSTSGDDNNYYLLEEDPSIVRSHILNPFTGYSENYYRSVTIACEDSMIADALTTALFNIGDMDKLMEIVNNVAQEFNVDIEVALLKEVDQEGQKCDLYMTKAFEELINEEYMTNHIREVHVIGN